MIESARRVIDIELEAIHQLKPRIDHHFAQACEIILSCKGRIVVLGMGKSGHIAKKIAATLASTGTPAFFVHPGEASHGDMGMITAEDVIIAISYSGETSELLNILPLIKRLGISLITFCGKKTSSLGKTSTVYLDVSVPQEACPLGLAPTASTTATLVMGDALAIALLEARGFTVEDFALFHPGGSLGKRLLLLVSDLMHTGDTIPIVPIDCSLSNALIEMTRKRLGMTSVVHPDGSLAGIYTDGDLRRTFSADEDMRNIPIAKVMTTNCKTIQSTALAVDALGIMEKYKITVLIVTDEQKHPIGVIHIHDLLRAGV